MEFTNVAHLEEERFLIFLENNFSTFYASQFSVVSKEALCNLGTQRCFSCIHLEMLQI